MQGVEGLRVIVEERIQSISFKRPPAELYQPITYTLQSSGKRIRPILTLIACQMFSEKFDIAIDPALGFEVFHNFTLLHDDIMDNAPVRRGMPTVHQKWNTNTAILSGDAMVIEAYKLVCKTPANCLGPVLELFSDTALAVCEGQMMDMQFESRDKVSEPEYMEMIRLKTAELLAASLKAGAIIGGATDTDAQRLYLFGINLGLAFQLKDDWLDTFGNSKEFGKKIGGDIVENKKTYLFVKAFELANEDEKKEMILWLQKKSFIEAEKIASVKQIFEKLNVDKITQKKVEEYSEKAFGQLKELKVEKDKKVILESLGQELLGRIK
jgi:geranylgeranyl diphosphate synthase, type II